MGNAFNEKVVEIKYIFQSKLNQVYTFYLSSTILASEFAHVYIPTAIHTPYILPSMKYLKIFVGLVPMRFDQSTGCV